MEKFTTTIEINANNEIVSSNSKDDNIEKDLQEEIIDTHHEKSHPSGHIHKKKRAKKSFYILSFFLGTIIIGIVLFMFVVTFCNLHRIEFDGVVNSNQQEIEAALCSDKYSKNMVYTWIKNSIVKNYEIPFVEALKLSPKDRNTIIVTVKEKDLAGVFDMGEDYVYFDLEGTVDEIISRPVLNIPVVSGIVPNSCEVGKSLDIPDTTKNALISTLRYLRAYDISLNQVIFEEDGTFGVMVEGIFIDFGISSDIDKKCERLSYILPDLVGQTGVLHLEEWGSENTDIIFEKSN